MKVLEPCRGVRIGGGGHPLLLALFLRRMTSKKALFRSDSYDKGTIHFQKLYCSASSWGYTHHTVTAPFEMRQPILPPWIVQRNLPTTCRIATGPASALPERTRDASEREIIFLRLSLIRNWADMIDLKSRLLTSLSKAAIFAPLPCALDHHSPERTGNTHATERFAAAARNFNRERNSASSTNPSASRRSRALRGFPESCWSKSSARRF